MRRQSFTMLGGAVALLMAAAAAGALTQQPGERPDASQDALRDTLVALERQSWVAWKGRNSTYFQDFLSEDHVEVGGRGVTDKAAVVASVGSPACVVSSYEVGGFRLTAFDDRMALLTYRAEQHTICGGNPVPSPAWASSLYVRRGARWVNAFYQQTPVSR